MRLKKGKRGRIVLLLIFALAVGAVGGTWASYYHTSKNVQNRLTTRESGVTLKEVFNPADQWVPGEDKQKEVSFGNIGQSDQVIRFKTTEIWYDNNGTPGSLNDDVPWAYTGTYDPQPAVIHYTSEVTGLNAAWVKIGDYYYYKKILAAETDTPLVIDSVSFSSAISNAGPGAPDDFSNKRYSLSVQMESLDVNTIETAAGWNMTFSQSGNALTWSTVP
jgi:alternate signal-mediated exported protein